MAQETIIWVSDRWILLPVGIWFVLGIVFSAWFSPKPEPHWGPADELVAGVPGTILGLIASGVLVWLLLWAIDAAGFHFGFTG